MPPICDALGQRLRRVDVEIVAGPDVERGLLEQEREADGEQHLPQRIGFDRDDGNSAQHEIERSGRYRGDGDELGPIDLGEITPAPDGQADEYGHAECDDRVADEFEPSGPQEKALHQQADHGDGQSGDRDRQVPRAGGPDHRQRDIAAQHEVRAVRQVDDPHHAEDQRQAAAEQKQQRAVGNAVEGLDDPEI